MTPEEHDNRILAKCREIIALGEKRTQGRWDKDTCCAIARCGEDDPDARRHIDGGFYKIVVEGDPDSCLFIAACAGPAEAAARSTIAAIEGLRKLAEPIDGDIPDEMCRAFEQDTIMAQNQLATIRSAWPEELL